MKNSNDTIRNRTSDLPTCSAVPQPTAKPGAFSAKVNLGNSDTILYTSVTTFQRKELPYIRGDKLVQMDAELMWGGGGREWRNIPVGNKKAEGNFWIQEG